MKKTKIPTYSVLFLLFLSACTNDYPCSTMEEHFKEYNYKPDVIRKSTIKSRTKIDNSMGRTNIFVLWMPGKTRPGKKIRAVDYFNDAGYLILSIEPKYEMQKADTLGFSKLTKLEQNFFQKEVETNMPSGQVDSTIFSYDNKNRIIRKDLKKQSLFGDSYSKSIEVYEYDDKNNCVKLCTSSESSPTHCWTTLFKYDKAGRIISEILEIPEELLRSGDPKQYEVEYSYYADGKLKSKRGINYIYENDRLQETYSGVENAKNQITKYKYDKEGNVIREENIRAIVSTYNPSTGKTSVDKYDTSTLRKTFNQQQLIIEWYSKYNSSRNNYRLYKYEY